jgi:histone H3/H4
VDILIIASKVKARFKGKEVRMAGDVVEELSIHLAQIIDVAAMKAKDDKMKTVQARHVLAALDELAVERNPT